jgi:hypothetical protein
MSNRLTSIVSTSVQIQNSVRKADWQYVPPKTTIAGAEDTDLHESPYTIPNALTVGRIIACPFLGYHIIQGNLEWATGILLVGGFSDGVSAGDRVDCYHSFPRNMVCSLGTMTDNSSLTAG